MIKQMKRGLYFDDFEIGDEFITPSRTITSTDIVNFCCLSGDFNEVHANYEYCKTTPFGEPVAHGPMVYAIAAGLQYASGVNEGSLLALLQIDAWKLLAPVKHGDTIRMKSTVLSKKESSKKDRGVVEFKREILNQNNIVVQEMLATFLYKRRV